MSSPATIVVLDGQSPSPAKKFLDSPDRAVVVLDNMSLARHALSTMRVAVFLCDMQLVGTDLKGLLGLAQFVSPTMQVVLTGPKISEKLALERLHAAKAQGTFFPRPWNGIALRKAVSDAVAAAQKAEAKNQPDKKAGVQAKTEEAVSSTPDPKAYDLIEAIGRGGTGTVFRALDKFLNIEVGIKIINPALMKDPATVAGLKDEARITMQLAHRNILRLYGLREYHGCNYIVMELVRGRSLRDIILENGSLSPACACQMLLQMGDALAYAHSANVVHNDIKPENVFLTDAGYIKIIDFGAATLRGVAEGSSGYIVGTPEFMPPEKLRGEIAGPPADIYALGIMTYLMMLGCYPFPADTTAEKLLAGVRPDFSVLPPPLAQVLDRATAYEPSFRYQSVREFVADLLPVCGCTALADDPFAPIIVEAGVPAPEGE